MLKDSISVKDVINILNEVVEKDPEAANSLFGHRVECNKKIADHPTIQVSMYPPDNTPKIGIIGILNGMFGIQKDGFGALAAEVDDNGKIIQFVETPDRDYEEY